MAIYPESNDIARYRRRFLETGVIDTSVIRPDIAESWKRSKAYGINAESSTLPARGKADRTYIKAGRARYNYSAWLYYYFSAASLVLSEMGGAEVCVDSNLTITLIIGDPVMIQELNSKGLRVGRNLAESQVGTNAMALAYEYGREVWVSGEEHYMEAFCDYVCVASWWQPPISTNYSAYSSMIVIHKERFTPGYRSLAHLFIGVQETFKLQHQQPLNIMRGKLIELLIERSGLDYILIANSGVILQYSAGVFELIGNHITNESSDYLQDCYPQLAFAVSYSHENREPAERVMSWDEPAGELLFRLLPIWTSENCIGTIILLTRAAERQAIDRLDPGHGEVATLPGRQPSEQHYRALHTFKDFMGSGPVLVRQLDIARRAAATRSNILISGESGTGKSLLAEAIHNAGPRRGRPFVTVCCSAIPAELFRGELFGYVDGVYPGARKYGAPGRIESADGGTLFLQDVEQMPAEVQSQLLAVLSSGMVSRLGAPEPSRVDVRVIASTASSLYELASSGKLKPELFFFLNVLGIELPPLCQRRGDIVPMASAFVEQFASRNIKPVSGLSEEAAGALMAYDWPGNVLELRNMMERCVSVTETEKISLDDLPSGFVRAVERSKSGARGYVHRRGAETYDRDLVVSLLAKYADNKTKVCEELGISRPTLYRKLKKWGLYDEE